MNCSICATEKTKKMNLDWIIKLIYSLPETSVTRKNIIAIAGYPKWENVNSNLLAFYFDEKEEHGFSRLFINSLLDIYETKFNVEKFDKDFFETDFSVEREVVTKTGKRIDLLISENIDDESENIDDKKKKEKIIANWAIIIENKLSHILDNDLADYWQSIEAKNKIGIVLSLNPINIPDVYNRKDIKFVNITHIELVEKVIVNLSEFYIRSDDRHLLFLKEYISNINSFSINEKETIKMDKTIQLFHSKKEEIEKLKKVDKDLLRYISDAVFEIMEEMGFVANSTKNSSKYKHFYAHLDSLKLKEKLKEDIKLIEKFRFWINLSELRYDKKIGLYRI